MLGCNCTVVADPETRQALIVDPGDEAPDILAAVQRLGVQAVKLVHTHAHFDHVLGTGEVAAHTGAEILLHRGDRWLYDNVALQARFFGLPPSATPAPAPAPTRELEGDEVLAFGQREARVLHTPGHTPGSICFFVERAGRDARAVRGRHPVPAVDRPHRSVGRLLRPDWWCRSAIVCSRCPTTRRGVPGHGPSTTIGAEREGNPFVGARARRSSPGGSHA